MPLSPLSHLTCQGPDHQRDSPGPYRGIRQPTGTTIRAVHPYCEKRLQAPTQQKGSSSTHTSDAAHIGGKAGPRLAKRFDIVAVIGGPETRQRPPLPPAVFFAPTPTASCSALPPPTAQPPPHRRPQPPHRQPQPPHPPPTTANSAPLLTTTSSSSTPPITTSSTPPLLIGIYSSQQETQSHQSGACCTGNDQGAG
ncbi:homeobox protein Hox-A3-like [Pseudophryne corroboree]|uniref:homeobox protein Hox-A3-like n=1 Tax=Pseudophryne corroboree TaxID=495146 RepID=UPI00308218C1